MTPEQKAKRHAYMKAYDEARKEKRKPYRKALYKIFYAANREEELARVRKWAKANPDKMTAKVARRNAKKLNATPPWLSRGMIEAINYKYETAHRLTEETGIPHQVDHIVPLQGETVSGLHVPWNLQVITAEENQRKNNSH